MKSRTISSFVLSIHQQTIRFMAKLPGKCELDHSLSFCDFLFSWIRLRDDAGNLLHARILKRAVHFWCQIAERDITSKVTDEIPPPIKGKEHPFSKHVRMHGGSAVIQKHLTKRFLSRGGGFVSTKDEKTLLELQLVSRDSRIASMTAGTFVAKLMVQQSEILQQHLKNTQVPVVNFIFDAARVFKSQVGVLMCELQVYVCFVKGDYNNVVRLGFLISNQSLLCVCQG